jgi:hypothetical protein
MHKNARYKPVIDQNDQTNHIIMFIIGSRHWQLTIMVLPMDMPWPTHVAQRHDTSTWDWTTLKNQQAAWWFLQGFIEPRAASQGTNCILELLQESLRGRKFSRSGYVCRGGTQNISLNVIQFHEEHMMIYNKNMMITFDKYIIFTYIYIYMRIRGI